MYRIGKNDIMWIRISYVYGKRHPIVEFQRVYCSYWYELDTNRRAYRINQLINRYSDGVNRFTQYVRNNQLVVSLAV